MRRPAKYLLLANGVIWAGLLTINAVLHFVYGWGQTVDVVLYGLVPLFGLGVEIVLLRLYASRRYRTTIWVSSPTVILALLYLFQTLLPGRT